MGHWDPQTYKTVKCVVDSFELDSILLIEGSILDSYSDARE
jgi:hypothetical protein